MGILFLYSSGNLSRESILLSSWIFSFQHFKPFSVSLLLLKEFTASVSLNENFFSNSSKILKELGKEFTTKKEPKTINPAGKIILKFFKRRLSGFFML